MQRYVLWQQKLPLSISTSTNIFCCDPNDGHSIAPNKGGRTTQTFHCDRRAQHRPHNPQDNTGRETNIVCCDPKDEHSVAPKRGGRTTHTFHCD